jgi:uncharacterized membrane protein YfcA
MAVGDLFLIVFSFFSSLLSAVTGVGGGMLLISIMPGFMPITAVIPVHGLVQFSSNASRALFAFRAIDRQVMTSYVLGAATGAAVGSRLVVALPSEWLPLLLAAFILIVTWTPAARASRRLPGKFFVLGWVQTFLSLFVGATGPLGPPVLLREGFRRDRLVATEAAFMSCCHLLKVLTFGLLGFVFRPYVILLVAMIGAVIFGSWVGTLLRPRLPENIFRVTVRIIITVLAMRMIVSVITRSM